MSAHQAAALDPPLAMKRVCGTKALRYWHSGGKAGLLAGLTLFIKHGKVASIVLMSRHTRTRCVSGGYELNP